ncbi:MAG: TolC family protein [Candidatus Margulisiibacteriota bacterium]
MIKRIISIALLVAGLGLAAEAMTYQESVSYALKHSPSVLAAERKLSAARARMGQAVGAFFPTIKLDGNYGKSYSQPSTMQLTTQTILGAITTDITFGTDEQATVKGWTLSASQPLFVAALWPGYGLATKGVDSAGQDYIRVKLETAFNATAAYFAVLSSTKYVKLSEDSMEMARSHVNQIELMLKSGVATRADLLRAEVQLANSEVALTQARNGLELAKSSFNNVLGRTPDEKVEISDGPTGQVPTVPEYAVMTKAAFENSPTWRSFSLARGMAADNVTLARTALLPSVFLSGQNGWRSTEYPSYRSDARSWSLTGAASWTLFDGLGMQNRINEAAANLEATEATEAQVKNGLLLEVRQAYLELKSAIETITSTKKAVDFAEESHKVSSLRFNSGVGTNLEEIDAQVALTQARTTQLKALFDLEIAKAKLNKVVGKEVI